MPSWGADLPPFFLEQGFSYSPRDGVERFDPEFGDPVTRLRFTGYMADISGSMPCTDAQKTALFEFWRDDLARGSLAFDWTDPMLEDSCSMQFVSRPEFSVRSGAWIASVSLVRLP